MLFFLVTYTEESQSILFSLFFSFYPVYQYVRDNEFQIFILNVQKRVMQL